MKQHLAVLDGLRGVGAVAIVVAHLQEMVDHTPGDSLLVHTYLAVDLFFALSGYVLGYAYDPRRDLMSGWDFMRVRVRRLHPLLVLGTVLGLLVYVFDPFADYQRPSFGVLAAVFGAHLLMIPTPTLPGVWEPAYYSFNIPAWTMLWEYLLSLLFAFALWRMRLRNLVLVTAGAGVALAFMLYHMKASGVGWDWGTIHWAPFRLLFPFCVGLLVYRLDLRIENRLGFIGLSLALLMICFAPLTRFNPFYDWLVVGAVLPLLMALAVGTSVGPRMEMLCLLSGRISYPLYILHYGVVTLFGSYYEAYGVPKSVQPFVVGGLTLVAIAIAYVAMVYFDEPLRAWLSRRAKARRASAAGGQTAP